MTRARGGGEEMPAIVKCPCGRLHRHVLFVTERYTHRFRCGLVVEVNKEFTEYRRHRKPIQVERMSAHPNNLEIRLEGYFHRPAPRRGGKR